jgi:hypothetical protein
MKCLWVFKVVGLAIGGEVDKGVELASSRKDRGAEAV